MCECSYTDYEKQVSLFIKKERYIILSIHDHDCLLRTTFNLVVGDLLKVIW